MEMKANKTPHRRAGRAFIAAAFVCLGAAECRAQGDAAFARGLQDIRSLTMSGTGMARRIGWKDWFKAPEPTRVPSPQEADPRAQQVVDAESSLYFIDKGRVFERDNSKGLIGHLEGARNTAAILLYRGILVARQEHGSLCLWNSERRQWVELGGLVMDVRTAGDDLVALTQKGDLLVFKGGPTTARITWSYTSMMNGSMVTIFATPMLSDRPVGFFGPPLGGVAGLESSGGEILVRFKDGRRVLCRDLSTGWPPP